MRKYRFEATCCSQVPLMPTLPLTQREHYIIAPRKQAIPESRADGIESIFGELPVRSAVPTHEKKSAARSEIQLWNSGKIQLWNSRWIGTT